MALSRSNVNYEVHVLQKGRWEIHARYPDNREKAALDEATELENQPGIDAVRVTRETYNPIDGSSGENIIFSSPGHKDSLSKSGGGSSSRHRAGRLSSGRQVSSYRDGGSGRGDPGRLRRLFRHPGERIGKENEGIRDHIVYRSHHPHSHGHPFLRRRRPRGYGNLVPIPERAQGVRHQDEFQRPDEHPVRYLPGHLFPHRRSHRQVALVQGAHQFPPGPSPQRAPSPARGEETRQEKAQESRRDPLDASGGERGEAGQEGTAGGVGREGTRKRGRARRRAGKGRRARRGEGRGGARERKRIPKTAFHPKPKRKRPS